MKTESEELFEALCDAHSIEWRRVPTASDKAEQRPDYELRSFGGRVVFAEVKQFDPNKEEKAAQKEMLAGRAVVFGTTPGERIRKAIAKASPQLKALSQGKHPTIVVVYNNVHFCHMHTDPYAVLTAMRGLDLVPVEVPSDPKIAPRFLPIRPGPKKKLTATENTTISALAVLYKNENAPVLDFFHNRFARVPLTSQDFGPGIRHFRMRDDGSDWESF